MTRNHDFTPYFEATADRPPRATLTRALAAFAAEGRGPGRAIDLGCGVGRDSLPLLAAGWSLLAVDASAEALAALRGTTGQEARLETLASRFEDLGSLPPSELINASFSLFLCEPAAFPQLWGLIRDALVPGGRFAGQLLGPRDDFAVTDRRIAFDRPAVEALCRGYEVDDWQEEQSDTLTPKGKAKHWHLHHLVLRRRAVHDLRSKAARSP